MVKAWLHVDKRDTWDHLVDASINTMKYLNGPDNGWIEPQISPWILLRNLSGSARILRYDGLKINFPVAQAVQQKSLFWGIFWIFHIITNRITDNFLHHPYYRVPKSIMPILECIDVLENYLISNMFYGLYICKVQFSLEWRNLFVDLFAISSKFGKEKKFLFVIHMCFHMETILTDVSKT